MTGRFLEEVINKKKSSIEKIASETGIRQEVIKEIIEKDAEIGFDNAYKLCMALGVPLAVFCREIPDNLADMIEYPMFSVSTIREIKNTKRSMRELDEIFNLVEEYVKMPHEKREAMLIVADCLARKSQLRRNDGNG